MSVAGELLKNTELSLAEIASRCGFADQSSMLALTSRRTGVGNDAASQAFWCSTPQVNRTSRRAKDDIVWSTAGAGRVRVSNSGGVMVGESSYIKGAKVKQADNRMQLVSVDERSGLQNVHVYSVGVRKRLFSGLRGVVEVAPNAG